MNPERLIGIGRSRAEAMMVDACRIRPVDQDEVTTDPVTGDVTTAPADPVYEGRCKIQNQRPFPSTPDAGEHQWTRSPMWLHLPVVGSGQVKTGHVVEITASINPDNVGRLFRVETGDSKTFQTALRFLVEEIVG
jgi:hypothetical protein